MLARSPTMGTTGTASTVVKEVRFAEPRLSTNRPFEPPASTAAAATGLWTLARLQKSIDDPDFIGARANDLQSLRAKLAEPWKPQDRVKALDNRVKDYEYKHGNLARRLQGGPVQGDAELAILNKAVQDGEEQLQIQSSEVPTVEVIKSGARDFIDYALTEVDRIVKVDNAGSVTSFDWKSQGHAQDIPALRRSQAEQWVSLEAQSDASMGASMGRNYMRATVELDASPFDGRRPKKAPVRWGEVAEEPVTRYSIV